jgi:hypothetical protein
VALEDQQRVIHMLALAPLKKLSCCWGGIVGGIDVEQDFATMGNWCGSLRMAWWGMEGEGQLW